jgi:hypothetical protein
MGIRESVERLVMPMVYPSGAAVTSCCVPRIPPAAGTIFDNKWLAQALG